MSTGQKYRRTEFEDNDDNNSAGEATSPGVVYNPVIAFHAASFGSSRGGLIGRGCCARWSGLEKLLMAVVAALSVVVIVLMAMLGARGHPDAMSSTNAVSSRLHAESPVTTRGNSNGVQTNTHTLMGVHHHHYDTILGCVSAHCLNVTFQGQRSKLLSFDLENQLRHITM